MRMVKKSVEYPNVLIIPLKNPVVYKLQLTDS